MSATTNIIIAGSPNGSISIDSDNNIVFSTPIIAQSNIIVEGDLTVLGTTVNNVVTTIQTTDPLIEFGVSNTDKNIGLYGQYEDVSSNIRYTGIMKDISDGIWKFIDQSTIPTTTDPIVSSDTLQVSTLLSENATVTNATITSLITPDLDATNITSSSLNTTAATIDNLTSTASTITNLTSSSSNIASLSSTNASITTGTVGSLTSTNATVTNLTSSSGTITNLTSTNQTSSTLNVTTSGTIASLSSPSANITTGTVGTLTSTSGNINSLTSTTGNITTLTSTTSNSGTANITTANVGTLNLASLTLQTLNVTTSATINSGTVTTLGSTTANITTGNITTGNIPTLTTTNGTITTLGSTTSNITTGNIATLNSTNSNITTGTVGTLTSTTANISNLTAPTSNSSNFTATNANITTGTVGTLTSTNATITTLNSTTGTVGTLTSTTGNIATLNSTNSSITTGTVGTLTSTNATITTLGSTTGNITTLNSTNSSITTGTVGTLTSTNATITTLGSTTGTVGTLTSTTGNIATLNSTNATLTTGTVGTLTSTTSNIATLNSTNSSITTGTVGTLTSTNATITTGNIATLSATNSTLTTSTITNLNSTTSKFNTTTGTAPINVGGSGSIVRLYPTTDGDETSITFYRDNLGAVVSNGDSWSIGHNSLSVGAGNFGIGRSTGGLVMQFLANGTVGIGKSPLTPLDVNGIITTNSGLSFNMGNTITITSSNPSSSRSYNLVDVGSNANFILSASSATGQSITASAAGNPNLILLGDTTGASGVPQQIVLRSSTLNGGQTQQMKLGYNRTINAGIIQCDDGSVGNTSLFINPSGGDISIGKFTSPLSKLNVNGSITIDSANSLVLMNSGNTFGTSLKSGAVTGNITLVLPTAVGSNGQVLTSDGTNMVWSNSASGNTNNVADTGVQRDSNKTFSISKVKFTTTANTIGTDSSSIGYSSSTNDILTGSVVNDMCLSNNGNKIILSNTGITTDSVSLDSSNVLTVGTGGIVERSESITSAGALSTTKPSIINSTTSGYTVTLANASDIDQIKFVKLLNKFSNNVIVTCNKGSFLLDASNSERRLRYTLNGWLTEYSSNESFFVTTQQGSKLVGTGTVGQDFLGNSVALSSDGNTLAISSYNNVSISGSIWIYVRSGSSWTQQGAKLSGTGASIRPFHPKSISLSSDGNTLAVGAWGDGNGIGAIWVFVRSGSVWSQEGSKLTVTGNIGNSGAGESISLSADGNTLAVGGSDDNTNVGAVWIFIRSAGVWSQQTKLVGTGNTGASNQGASVSLSANGNTLAVGGNEDNSNTGATWIYIRKGTTWSQQGNKLVGTGNTGAASQGKSVKLSADGNTLAVGGYIDNSNVGATWVFTRSNSEWTQQGDKLVSNDSSGSSFQGFNVTLSADGNTLAVGGYGDNSNIGAVWIYLRSGSSWSQQGNKIIGTGYSGTPTQGRSVSLCADGNTLAVGGDSDSSNTGAAWIFI